MPESTDDLRRLLEEIRDTQREHLAEYKRVTHRSLALQEQAVARQEQISRLYQRVVMAGSILVVGGVIWVVYLMYFVKQVR